MNYLGLQYALGASADIDPEMDLIRVWIAMKGEMFRSQGGYQAYNSQGQLVYTTAPGSSTFQPHITASQARAMHLSWLAFAYRMQTALANAGKNEWAKYSGRFASDSYSPPQGGGPYLSVSDADLFFKITGRFVRDLNSGLWAGYNIGTAYQDFKWALDNTTGGFLVKGFLVTGEYAKAAYEAVKNSMPGIIDGTLEAFGTIWTLLKWGSIAGVGYLAYKTVQGARGSR